MLAGQGNVRGESAKAKARHDVRAFAWADSPFGLQNEPKIVPSVMMMASEIIGTPIVSIAMLP